MRFADWVRRFAARAAKDAIIISVRVGRLHSGCGQSRLHPGCDQSRLHPRCGRRVRFVVVARGLVVARGVAVARALAVARGVMAVWHRSIGAGAPHRAANSVRGSRDVSL